MTNTEGVKPVQVDWKARYMEVQARVLERDQTIHRLTHQPDTAAQPVAWMYTRNGNSDLYHSRREELTEANGWTETPLYAQPASQPVGDVERQNLIDKINHIQNSVSLAKRRLELQGSEATLSVASEMREAFGLAYKLLPDILAALSRHPDPQPI